MAEDLKQQAAKGIIWKFIENGGIQAIQFFSGIYIARILLPEDYGLIGMMAIFLGISQVFIDSGFRYTLIQRNKNITHDHYNVVFMFNLVVSCFFYLLMFFGAPLIAKFFHEPRLLLISRVLGLNLIFISLGIIHRTILEKKLKFRTLSKSNLLAVLISVIAGVIMTKLGFKYWALVAMTLLQNAIFTITIWIINKWTPTLSFNFTIFKELYSKSIQIFTAGIISSIGNNIYSVMIGRYFTTNDVGFFSQGQKLQKRVGNIIVSSMQNVMYPVQSRMQDDLPRLKNAVRKNLKYTTLVTLPAIIGFIAIAKPFVLITLTEKWLPSIYYLQILSVAAIFTTIKAALNSYINALGLFQLSLKFSLLRNSIPIILIIIGLVLKLDLKILVLGLPITELLSFTWVLYFSKKIINYTIREVVIDLFPSVMTSVIMGAVVLYLSDKFQVNIYTLILQVIIGGISYILLNYLFNKELLYEAKSLLFKR